MTKLTLGGLAVAIVALSPCAAVAQSPRADAAPVRSFAMPPLEKLQATRDRPLFSPKRRPDAPTEKPDEPVVQEAPEAVAFELTGVVMGEARAVAILHNRETQETVHLRQGEMLDVWSVDEIAPRHVVLRSEGKELRLQLFEAKPEGASTPPPPARSIEFSPPQQRRHPSVQQQRRIKERTRQRIQ